MRSRSIANIVVRITLIRLVRMSGCSEAIQCVVGIVVRPSIINHLGDVVDGVELILKIKQRVWCLSVG